jgi:branched-chain amino acid transport system ATP-binding protein
MPELILKVDGITKDFDGLRALTSVSFSITKGLIKSLIGPNGAGKTTLFNIITGVYHPTGGKIFFGQTEITQKPPYAVSSLGIARTFQNVRIFTFNKMTVMDNLLIGGHRKMHAGIFQSAFWLPQVRKEEAQFKEKALQILDFIGLKNYHSRIAQSLPFGQQRLLEVARALMSDPDLLLIDEPVAGLNDSETKGLTETLLKIKAQGITCLLIEHHMGLVMEISDEIVVLNFGEKIAEGPPVTIKNDPVVIAAYLGKES